MALECQLPEKVLDLMEKMKLKRFSGFKSFENEEMYSAVLVPAYMSIQNEYLQRMNPR